MCGLVHCLVFDRRLRSHCTYFWSNAIIHPNVTEMLALARPGNPIPPVNDHCFGVSKLGIRFHNHLAFRFQIFIIHVNVLYTMFPPASCEHLVSNPHERTRRILNIIQKIGWQIPCLSHLFPRLRRDICQLGTNVSEASNETVICLCRGLLHTKAMLALGGSPLHARYRQRFPRHARCRQEALDHPDEAGGRTDWHPGGCVSVLVHRNLAGRFTPPCITPRGGRTGGSARSIPPSRRRPKRREPRSGSLMRPGSVRTTMRAPPGRPWARPRR